MDKGSCKTCYYCAEIEVKTAGYSSTEYYCRYYPPVPNGLLTNNGAQINPYYWCGKYVREDNTVSRAGDYDLSASASYTSS